MQAPNRYEDMAINMAITVVESEELEELFTYK